MGLTQEKTTGKSYFFEKILFIDKKPNRKMDRRRLKKWNYG